MIGSIAILDSPFSMFLTAGMVLFYLSTECADNKVRQRRYLAGSGVMYGLAFLTKGFLAFALPGIILLPFILITKKYNLIWRSSWVILFVIITIAPWSIAIHLREPDYWHYFVWEEHVRRFLSPNAQHAAPFYYYFISLPIAAFPWIGFLPAAVAGHFKKSQNISLNWYLILWLCLPLLFFSISSGKLISYILPCMAPLAVLVTIGTINYLKSGNQRWFVFGSIISTATLAILLYLLLHNELSASGTPYFNEKEQLKFIVLAGGLLIACILMFLSVFFTAIHSRLILVLCGAGMILPLVNISVPNSVLGNKSPSFIINHVLNKTKDNAILVSDANVVRSVAWVFKRSDIYLLSTGEFGYGLSYPEHADKLLGVAGLKTLIEKQKRGEISNDIAVFCEEPCTQSLKTLLGHHADQMSNDEFSAWYIQAK
jgi:4-amino-4-deoxy-L-arabinose transferase